MVSHFYFCRFWTIRFSQPAGCGVQIWKFGFSQKKSKNPNLVRNILCLCVLGVVVLGLGGWLHINPSYAISSAAISSSANSLFLIRIKVIQTFQNFRKQIKHIKNPLKVVTGHSYVTFKRQKWQTTKSTKRHQKEIDSLCTSLKMQTWSNFDLL